MTGRQFLLLMINRKSDLIAVSRLSACMCIYIYTITKTCPCNVYPLEPHFYIAKLGYAEVYIFFLFLPQNIDCGYSLEPPCRGSSNVYPQAMFLAKIRKNIFFYSAENFQFLNLKSLFLLHGQVFVMQYSTLRNVLY